MNTIFLTFGDGNSEMVAAATRLAGQAAELGIFSKVIQLDSSSLSLYSADYRSFSKELPRLTGSSRHYWATKPFILNAALLGKFGDCDQAIYADAGCEIVNNAVSRFRLRKALDNAQSYRIGMAQQIPYLEKHFTKDATLQYLDPTLTLANTFQIQATVIIINKSESSIDFLAQWIALSHPDLNLWQENRIPEPGLIGHRHDQSIFSILWKKNGLQVCKFYWDGARKENKLLDFLTSSYAIQAVRNRTGTSSISKQISTNTVFALIGLGILHVHGFLRKFLGKLKSD